MMFETATPEARIKAAVSPQEVLFVRSLVSYFTKTIALWEHPEMRPFISGKKLSVGGLLDDYESIVQSLKKIVPYVEKGVTAEEASKLREHIDRLKRTTRNKRKTIRA